MSVDWDETGLLDGLEDEAAREERSALLEELHEDGVSLDDLRSAVEDGRLAFLPLERALYGDSKRLTAEEVAERTNLPVELVTRIRRALGLPTPAPDERVFLEADLDAIAIVGRFQEAGFSEEDQLDVTRLIGRNMAQIAEAVGGLAARTVARPGDSERDFARRLAQLADALEPALGPVLEAALSAHLRQNAQHAVVDASDLQSGVLPGSRTMAVAFADLVGFTKLGEQMDGDGLGPVVGRLEQIAEEAAEAPVKVVKMIGDAAMLVSPELDPLLEATLALVERAEEDDDLPRLRAGVALGEVLSRGGDWYGRPVNLASRITTIAKAGSVLVTDEVREAGDDERWRWSAAGRKKLKGIRGERPLHRVRRRQGDEDDR